MSTEDDCICHKTTKDRAALCIRNSDNKIYHHFHMDCPIHGIKIIKRVDSDGNEITEREDNE